MPGIPVDKGTTLYVVYRGRLSVDAVNDGSVNVGWVYDDLSLLGKHIKDGVYDQLFGEILSDVKSQKVKEYADTFERTGVLTPEIRNELGTLLFKEGRLGNVPNVMNPVQSEFMEFVVFLTAVTMP